MRKVLFLLAVMLMVTVTLTAQTKVKWNYIDPIVYGNSETTHHSMLFEPFIATHTLLAYNFDSEYTSSGEGGYDGQYVVNSLPYWNWNEIGPPPGTFAVPLSPSALFPTYPPAVSSSQSKNGGASLYLSNDSEGYMTFYAKNNNSNFDAGPNPDYISASPNPPGGPPFYRTASMWIRPDSNALSGYKNIYSAGAAIPVLGLTDGLLCLVDGAGVATYTIATQTLSADTWYHLEYSYGMALGDPARIFVDGALVASTTMPIDVVTFSGPTLGHCDGFSAFGFTGYVDDFVVTDYVRNTVNFTPPAGDAASQVELAHTNPSLAYQVASMPDRKLLIISNRSASFTLDVAVGTTTLNPNQGIPIAPGDFWPFPVAASVPVCLSGSGSYEFSIMQAK